MQDVKEVDRERIFSFSLNARTQCHPIKLLSSKVRDAGDHGRHGERSRVGTGVGRGEKGGQGERERNDQGTLQNGAQ